MFGQTFQARYPENIISGPNVCICWMCRWAGKQEIPNLKKPNPSWWVEYHFLGVAPQARYSENLFRSISNIAFARCADWQASKRFRTWSRECWTAVSLQTESMLSRKHVQEDDFNQKTFKYKLMASWSLLYLMVIVKMVQTHEDVFSWKKSDLWLLTL